MDEKPLSFDEKTFVLLVWRPEVPQLDLSWQEIISIDERIKGLDPIPDFQPLGQPSREYELLKTNNILGHGKFKRQACYTKFAYTGRPSEFARLRSWPLLFASPSRRRQWRFICTEWYLTLGWEFMKWLRNLEEKLNLDRNSVMEFLKVHCPAFPFGSIGITDLPGDEWQSINVIDRWLMVRGLRSEGRDVTTAIAIYSGVFEADEIPQGLRAEWPLMVDDL